MSRGMLHTLVLCLVVAALLSACTGTRDPRLTVSQATLAEVTDEAALVHIGLRLENVNDDPLELLEIDYAVDVDGRRVFQGVRAAQMTLARKGVREVAIPAVIRFDQLGWASGAMPEQAEVRVHGSLRYLLPGTLSQTLFDTGVRRPRTSFAGALTVTLRGTDAQSSPSPGSAASRHR